MGKNKICVLGNPAEHDEITQVNIVKVPVFGFTLKKELKKFGINFVSQRVKSETLNDVCNIYQNILIFYMNRRHIAYEISIKEKSSF